MLRESTRGVRDKTRGQRASVEEINKTSNRVTRDANGQLLRGSIRKVRNERSVQTGKLRGSTRRVREENEVHAGKC